MSGAVAGGVETIRTGFFLLFSYFAFLSCFDFLVGITVEMVLMLLLLLLLSVLMVLLLLMVVLM